MCAVNKVYMKTGTKLANFSRLLNNLPFYIFIDDEYVSSVHILSSSENVTKKLVSHFGIRQKGKRSG